MLSNSRPGAARAFVCLALLALAGLAWAQTASEKPSGETRRVGSRLACQCGCKDSVASCSMLECSFSKPSKERIAKMQALGMTDRQIIDAFVGQYGVGIYLAPPNLFGMLVPYVAAGLGVFVIWWFIRRYRPLPAPEVGAMELDDPALAKYKDQIERDLANLE
jgi:cytochrome c-type biogenesis protein CcmH